MEHYKHFLPLILLLGLSGAVTAVINVDGILGKSVLLNVNAPVPVNAFIQWNFNSVLVAQYYSSASTCSGRLVGRCEVYHNGSLRIDNVTDADQGTYVLNTQILGSGISPNNTNYRLTVYAALRAPILRINDTNSPLLSGTYVSLQCDAGNQSVTTYTFYYDQEDACSWAPYVTCRESFLYFTPITKYDTGSYTCTIQNPVSFSTSNTLNLTVIVPVSNVMVTSNVSGLVWPGIDSVSLRCTARGTNVKYSWSLQGAPISGGRFNVTENNATLIISPVSNNDSGSFICTATNIINSQNSSVKLKLASPVSAVTLTSNTSEVLWAGEDSVSLNCSAQGSAITFSWSLNGKPVSPNPPYYITQSDSPPNSNLTISPVSKNDTGPFTCTASNLANSVTSNATSLYINWSPDTNILCTAEPIAQDVRLGCSWSGGKPAANVTMIFHDVQNTSSNEVFRNVTSSNIHGSKLTCNGNQLERTSSCVLPLEPPNSPDHKNDTKTEATEGDTVVLTLNLQAGTQSRAGSLSSQVLPAQFSWFRGADNSPIQNSDKFSVNSSDFASTLRIHKVSESESGKYECRAKNFLGSTTFLFNVEVSKEGSNGLNGGEIAGIVIGVLAGVTLIGIIVFFVMKKN